MPVSYTHLDVYKRQGTHQHGYTLDDAGILLNDQFVAFVALLLVVIRTAEPPVSDTPDRRLETSVILSDAENLRAGGKR